MTSIDTNKLFQDAKNGFTEISQDELANLIDMMGGDTPGFIDVLSKARQFQTAGMTPRILWDLESSHLIIRCDETKDAKKH
jgi:hypothetical protein